MRAARNPGLCVITTRDAAAELGGHALALTLLGNYLVRVYGGDGKRWHDVPLGQADERQGEWRRVSSPAVSSPAPICGASPAHASAAESTATSAGEPPTAILELLMRFEWDETKAAANLAKHGVSFEEARTVFEDPLFLDYYDPDHSDEEHRYIIVGESQERQLLMVSYTERGHTLRIISARKANATERRFYEQYPTR